MQGVIKTGAFATLVLVGILVTTQVHAQPVWSTGSSSSSSGSSSGGNQVCDPEYMDTLKQRAWMQAQREIELNANLITKPDSVLKLTCFGQHLNHAANSYIFKPPEGVSPKDILKIPWAASVGHINNGFQFSLLGGSFKDDSSSSGFSDTVKAESYGVCKKMESVWMAVQCTNMDPDALFPDLESFVASEDKRTVPKQCASLSPDNESGWNNALDRMKTKEVASNTDGYFDSVKLFRDKWAPANDVGCFESGIPTGVCVMKGDASSGDGECPGENNHMERVCPNPGCYYTGGSSGTCQPIN